MAELIQIASKLFPVPLDVRALDDDVDWQVREDFYCVDPVLGRIDVAAGTITDFGSIPKVFQNLISPVNRYRKPFLIHDRNYTMQELNGMPLTQKQADDCLLRGMKERDEQHNAIAAHWWKKKIGLERGVIYSALRMGGWIVWAQHRRENEAKRKPGYDLPA